MHPRLTDQEIQNLHEKLKQDLALLPEENRYLEFAFDSAAKHMPVYLKIVKGHVEQLAKVLQLETHHNRNLESAGLAEPVVQLIQLFRELNEEDIQLLEALALEAHNWRADRKISAENLIRDTVNTVASEA